MVLTVSLSVVCIVNSCDATICSKYLAQEFLLNENIPIFTCLHTRITYSMHLHDENDNN